MKGTGAKRNFCPGSCVSTGAKFPVAPVESAPMASVASAKAAWYEQRRKYYQLRRQKCTGFWHDKIDADWCNPRRPWQSVDVLLGRGRVPANSAIDAESLNRFFAEVRSNTADAPPPAFSLPRSAASFTAFTLLTVDDIVNAVRQLPDKFSAADPLPTSTFKQVVDLLAVHRRSVQPFAGSRSLPRGFQEGVHHSDGEEAWHGHDRRLIIPADLELASAVETPGAPRRPPAHGLVAVHRPAASQPELI